MSRTVGVESSLTATPYSGWVVGRGGLVDRDALRGRHRLQTIAYLSRIGQVVAELVEQRQGVTPLLEPEDTIEPRGGAVEQRIAGPIRTSSLFNQAAFEQALDRVVRRHTADAGDLGATNRSGVGHDCQGFESGAREWSLRELVEQTGAGHCCVIGCS